MTLRATLAMVVLATACGDAGRSTTTEPLPVTTVAGTTTTAITAGVTTTGPVVTTPPPTTAPPAAQPDVREVTGVSPDDPEGLNVRSGPGVDNAVVGSLPYDYSGVVVTGRSQQVDGTTWVELDADGLSGWANGAFLQPVAADSVPFSEQPCRLDAADGVPVIPPAPGGTGADHVLRWRHHGSSGCSRTVIVLGREFSFGEEPAHPADVVPAGVAVTSDGNVVRVDLGAIIDADPEATEADRNGDGKPDGFVVRTAGGSGAIYAALHHDDVVSAGAFFLEAPARIVIDVRPQGVATGLLPATDTFAAIVTDLDAPGACMSPPFTVSGYARPFEAFAEVAIREAPEPGAPAGGGERVEASYSGGFLEPTTDTGYAVSTTDWAAAWGEYSFTVEAVAPGRYELFVGEAHMETGEPIGAFQVFCVE